MKNKLISYRFLKWLPLVLALFSAIVLVLYRGPILREIGMIYLEDNQPKHAKTCFEFALRAMPNDVESLHGLGVALGELGKWSEAVNILERVVILDSKDSISHLNLGVAYDNIKRHQEAIREYKFLIKKDSSMIDAWVYLGLSYEDLDRLQEAVGALEAGVRLAPHDPEIQYELGRLYALTDKDDKARRQVSILKRLDPKLSAKLQRLLLMDRQDFKRNARQEIMERTWGNP